MRALVIDDEAKGKAAAVMAYARAHIYDPSEHQLVPGDNPRYVCHLNTYRCVFTYTRDPKSGKLYRHLSISVPSNQYPNLISAAAIAGLFEFSGADLGVEKQLANGRWLLHVEKKHEPHCIVLAEELRDEK